MQINREMRTRHTLPDGRDGTQRGHTTRPNQMILNADTVLSKGGSAQNELSVGYLCTSRHGVNRSNELDHMPGWPSPAVERETSLDVFPFPLAGYYWKRGWHVEVAVARVDGE